LPARVQVIECQCARAQTWDPRINGPMGTMLFTPKLQLLAASAATLLLQECNAGACKGAMFSSTAQRNIRLE
jgi:hypothetical protein